MVDKLYAQVEVSDDVIVVAEDQDDEIQPEVTPETTT